LTHLLFSLYYKYFSTLHDTAPAATTAPVVEAPKEEEVDALAGGMDMFGGGEGGGDY
jgi:hypothetical protein